MAGMQDIYNTVFKLISLDEAAQHIEGDLEIPLTMFFFDSFGWSIVAEAILRGDEFFCKKPQLVESRNSDRDLFISAQEGPSKLVISTKIPPVHFHRRNVKIFVECDKSAWLSR